jgi:integrase
MNQPWYWKSRKGWYLYWQQRRVRLGRTREEAWKKWQTFYPGEGVNAGEASVVSLSQRVEAWLQTLQKRIQPRTLQRYRRHLWVLVRAGWKYPFTLRDLMNYLDQKKTPKPWSPATVRVFVHTVCTFMREQSCPGWDPRDPGTQKPYRELRQRVEFGLRNHQTPREELDGLQYARLLYRCSTLRLYPFGLLLRFSWHTGARPQESTRLLWGDYHPEMGTHGSFVLPAHRGKGYRTRHIVCDEEAARVLQLRRNLWSSPNRSVFLNSLNQPWSATAISRTFSRLYESDVAQRQDPKWQRHPEMLEYLKTLSVPGYDNGLQAAQQVTLQRRWCLYDFRHAFVTRLLRRGIPPYTVACLVGHRGTAMIERVYSHLPQDVSYLARILQDSDPKR